MNHPLVSPAQTVFMQSPRSRACALSTSLSSLVMTQTVFMLWERVAFCKSTLLTSLRILNFYKLGHGLSRPFILSFKSLFNTENLRIHFFGFCIWLWSCSHE